MRLAARELVERSVGNYIEAQIEHSLSEQCKAKARRARETAAAAGNVPDGVRGDDEPDEDDEEDLDDETHDRYEDILPVIMNFPSLRTRHTNSVQDEKVEDWYQNNAAPLFNAARDAGCAATSACYRPQDLNFGHKNNSMDKENPCVYHEVKRGKGGSTGNGASRLRGLARGEIRNLTLRVCATTSV